MNILSLFVVIPVLMLLGLWIARNVNQVRGVMVAGSSCLLALSVWLTLHFIGERAAGNTEEMILRATTEWFPALHINYEVGVDGISVVMLLLSSIIVFTGTFASWKLKPLTKEFFMWFTLLSTGVYGFFVQNEESKRLLESIGIKDVDVVGDTRFDRVLQIKQAAKHLPICEAFRRGVAGSDSAASSEKASHPDYKVFVAGSSWPPDEEIFIRTYALNEDGSRGAETQMHGYTYSIYGSNNVLTAVGKAAGLSMSSNSFFWVTLAYRCVIFTSL